MLIICVFLQRNNNGLYLVSTLDQSFIDRLPNSLVGFAGVRAK